MLHFRTLVGYRLTKYKGTSKKAGLRNGDVAQVTVICSPFFLGACSPSVIVRYPSDTLINVLNGISTTMVYHGAPFKSQVESPRALGRCCPLS